MNIIIIVTSLQRVKGLIDTLIMINSIIYFNTIAYLCVIGCYLKYVSMFCFLLLAPSPECREEADVVIGIDATGSIGSDDYDTVKDFTKSLIEMLEFNNQHIRLGLFNYGDRQKNVNHLGSLTTKTQAKAAVDDLDYLRREETNTGRALRYVHENMFSTDHDVLHKQNFLILITHGGSSDAYEAYEEAMKAKAKDIHIIVVAAGPNVDETELRTIASYPHEENLIVTRRYRDLIEKTKKIKEMLCNGEFFKLNLLMTHPKQFMILLPLPVTKIEVEY